jgi:hypothetical protein
MRIALSAKENPFDSSLETVLPGVHSRMEVIARQQATQCSMIEQLFTTQEEKANERHDKMMMCFANFFQAASSAFVCAQQPTAMTNTEILGASTMMGSQQAAPVGAGGRTGGANNARGQDGIHLSSSYKSLVHIWDEWHGVNSREGWPVVGGICKLEASSRGKWRSHFKPAETKHLSRVRAIIKCVENYTRHIQPDKIGKEMDILANWDSDYKGQCRHSLSNFIALLQERKLIPKQRPRGRASKRS